MTAPADDEPRIPDALFRARRAGVPTSLDAIDSLRKPAKRGDEDWAYALALEIRDRLRDVLHRHKELAAAWEEAQPPAIEDRWKALAAAVVSHEFGEAGLPAPKWTLGERLSSEWVFGHAATDRGRDQAADTGVVR